MTELKAVEKKDGRYLSLEEFLDLEYEENSRETLKQDLAFIINNFHNLTKEFSIEPVRNFDNFVVEYESTTVKRGALMTTTVRTPTPRERDLTREDINPNNTYANVEYRDMHESIQPIFHPQDAHLYLNMTQRALRENLESSKIEE